MVEATGNAVEVEDSWAFIPTLFLPTTIRWRHKPMNRPTTLWRTSCTLLHLKDPAPSLFSELAALLLVCRLVYPLPYALDVDLVRTQVWLTGLYATIMVAACALYPETMQPLFA